MNKIKILHLIKSLGRGGAEMLLPETVRHHDKDLFEFHCIYFLPWKDQMVPALEGAGVRVMCLNANNNFTLMSRLRRLAAYIRKNEIDVIHCHLPWAGVLGRLAHRITGVPIVYTEHNKQERYHFITRRINIFTLGWNNNVLAVSDEVADSIRKFKGNKFKVQTLSNGVDTEKYKVRSNKEEAKKNLGLEPSSLVVGNVCVFRVQKRLMTWLDVAAKILQEFSTVRFILVGDGPLASEVAEKIDALGIGKNVLRPGLQEDVRPFLSAMDVFMISSRFEGLPIALLEAMAMEIPVVATAAGGIPEAVVQDVSGFIVPLDEPERLTGLVQKLLGNADLRKAVGEQARIRINEKYSITQMVTELEKVYRKVMNEGTK